MPVISRYSKIDTRFSILASVPYRVHQLLQWVYPCDYDEFSRITRFTSTSSYFCRVFIRLALKRIMLPRILLVESCEGAHNVRLRGLVVKLQWIDAELQATYFAGGWVGSFHNRLLYPRSVPWLSHFSAVFVIPQKHPVDAQYNKSTLHQFSLPWSQIYGNIGLDLGLGLYTTVPGLAAMNSDWLFLGLQYMMSSMRKRATDPNLPVSA